MRTGDGDVKQTERKLAAIMLADIAGYSALMERDEGPTFERVRALREHLIVPLVAKHQGRIIKTTGDGFLAEFASATAALRCGVELQRQNHAEQGRIPAESRFHLRIGLNLGDVILDGDDVSGDGVNVAARLEPLSPLDGLCLSGAIRDQVREDLGVVFEDLGEQTVKNISRPIRAYRVNLTGAPLSPLKASKGSTGRDWRIPAAGGITILALALAGWLGWHMWGSKADIPSKGISLLVLPFTSIPADQKGNDFADSITQDLTIDMSRIHDAFVIDFLTSRTLRGKAMSVRELGVAFKVRYVVTGTVRRDSSRLRVDAQLVSTQTGATLWGDQFDKQISDLFSLQDEITANVANAVDSTIILAEGQRSSHNDLNIDAYDLVAQARAIMYRAPTKDDLRKVIELMSQALKIDPKAVDALVQRSRAAGLLVSDYHPDDSAVLLQQSIDDAIQAVTLAPNYAPSHLARGFSYALQSKYQAADAEYSKCNDADPSMAYCHASRGFMMPMFGHAVDAPAMIQHAIDLNPRSAFIDRFYYYMGNSYLYTGRPDLAADWLERAIQGNPAVATYYVDLVAADTERSRPAEAQAALSKVRALAPTLTVAQYLKEAISDDPTYVARRKQIADDLLKAGLPRE